MVEAADEEGHVAHDLVEQVAGDGSLGAELLVGGGDRHHDRILGQRFPVLQHRITDTGHVIDPVDVQQV